MKQHSRSNPQKTIVELKFGNHTPGFCDSLVRTMPARIHTLIKANKYVCMHTTHFAIGNSNTTEAFRKTWCWHILNVQTFDTLDKTFYGKKYVEFESLKWLNCVQNTGCVFEKSIERFSKQKFRTGGNQEIRYETPDDAYLTVKVISFTSVKRKFFFYPTLELETRSVVLSKLLRFLG